RPGPMAAMRPPSRPTSAGTPGRPVPSTTVPPLSTRSNMAAAEDAPGDAPVGVGTAVPVELPVRADLLDEVQVQVRGHQLVLVPAALGQDLPVGIAEVRAAVELAEVPGGLAPHAVVGPDEV